MKAWTTQLQLDWLRLQIPEFRKALRRRKVGTFFEDVTLQFLNEFSVSEPNRSAVGPVSLLPRSFILTAFNLPVENKKVVLQSRRGA